ncbi:MAG: hypothetical protein LBF19_01660 [Prevotellaceae bacterium]|jgi:hypothetical protein|nr:hypothetical protein [Prevotellaceae bacterium]
MKKLSSTKTALLLLALLGFGSFCYAQSVVRVTQLSITEGAVPALTFHVGWATPPSSTPNHRDTVWIFADYRTVNPDGSVGAWTSATITGATTTAGTLSYPVSLPGRGFYLIGNSSGALDATLTVTLATPVNTKFNACVYASDWPPNATLQSGGGYALKGTPPFIINGTIIEPSHSFGSGACITSITDSTGCPGFVVNPPIVTGSILTTGDTVCTGDAPKPITGIMPFDGGDGRLSYSWYKDGDLIADATGADYTPPDTLMPGVYTYTRKVNDQTCNIMPLASDGNWVLTVGEAPSVTLSAASATVCAGTQVTLTATAGAAFYNFNNTDWQPSNTTNVAVTANATYTVKARSAAGCETVAAASTTVAAGAAPTNITLSASSTTVCVGTEITLEASADGAASYSFNGSAWQAGNTKNVTVNGDTTFTVKAASAAGCESAEATETVAVEAAPANITLSAASATVCAGTSVRLTATTGAASYNFNNVGWQTANTTDVIVTANATYTVKAASALGCESAEATKVIATYATVGAASITGDVQNTCPDASVTLTATVSGATSYIWYKDGQQVQSGVNANYTATATGNYTVQGKSAYCTGTTSVSKAVTINSGCVPGCPGFRLYQTTEPYDFCTDYLAARSGCKNLGARIPSQTELECMCANQATLPGGLDGFPNGNDSYLGAVDEAQYSYKYVRSWDCITGQAYHTSLYVIRCVIDD